MSFEKISRLLALHQDWLDSDGRCGQRATYLGKRSPAPNFYTPDNRHIFIPALAPQDDDIFTESDLAALRGLHNYPLPPLRLARSDFRGADFNNIRLEDADFSGADLQNSAFGNAAIYRTTFDSAQLSEASFFGCTLKEVSINSALLEGASFSHVQCSDSLIQKSNLAMSLITDSSFAAVSFVESRMSECAIATSTFDRVDLGKALFSRSTIEACRFNRVKLSGSYAAHLQASGTAFHSIRAAGCSWHFCLFRDCEFHGLESRRASFAGSVFQGVSMSDSNLQAARLYGVLLEDVSVVSSDLSYADFSDLHLVTRVWLGDRDEPEDISSIFSGRGDRAQSIMETKYISVPETYATAVRRTSLRRCNVFKLRIKEDVFSSLVGDDMAELEGQLDLIRERKKRKCRVFLCYAREDETAVTDVYVKLKLHRDMDPWMDRRKLRVGQKWDNIIQEEIGDADVFIVFLSSQSVLKRGYYQKEFKGALEAAKGIPEEDVFIMPVKLDDCEVPRSLLDLHWLDYSDKGEEGFLELMRTIREQFSKVIDRESRAQRAKARRT